MKKKIKWTRELLEYFLKILKEKSAHNSMG